MGGYSNIAVRDSQGNIIGYQSTSTGQTSLGTGDINYANPITQQSFNNFNAINAQYEASRNRVIGGDGVMYQGPTYQTNPYRADTAAGIAWEVARTGGATDVRLNRIAEMEVIRSGGDPGFIRYATDIYAERPRFAQETLTTKQGQTFVNPAWEGVPIRLNLTKAEMAAGGGITEQTAGKYLRYDPESFMLNRLTAPPTSIGVDTGVHKARGDFGGPILQPDGSYGGWMPGGSGRLRGGKTVAGVMETTSLIPSAAPAAPAKVTEVMRPSDFDLEVTRMFGGGAVSGAMISASDFFLGGRTMLRTTEEKLPIRESSVPIEPSIKVYDLGGGSTLTETTTGSLTTREGGVVSKTVSTPIPSGFAEGESLFSQKVTKSFLPETAMVKSDYISSFAYGAYQGIREKPLTAAVSFGAGLGLAALSAGVVNPFSSSMVAATAGTRAAPIVGAMDFFIQKGAPVALAGIYSADVWGRSTGFGKDYSPSAAKTFGGIASTEIAPMVAGGLTYSYRAPLFKSATDVGRFGVDTGKSALSYVGRKAEPLSKLDVLKGADVIRTGVMGELPQYRQFKAPSTEPEIYGRAVSEDIYGGGGVADIVSGKKYPSLEVVSTGIGKPLGSVFERGISIQKGVGKYLSPAESSLGRYTEPSNTFTGTGIGAIGFREKIGARALSMREPLKMSSSLARSGGPQSAETMLQGTVGMRGASTSIGLPFDLSPRNIISSITGKVSGIRGSLKGRWDKGLVGDVGEKPIFKKMPSGAYQRVYPKSSEGTGGSSGYIPSSGWGAVGGKSGSAASTFRMPSSGVSGLESIIERPQTLTQQMFGRNRRAYDFEYEYVRKSVPGMKRPESSDVIFRQQPKSELRLSESMFGQKVSIPSMVGVGQMRYLVQSQKVGQVSRQRSMIDTALDTKTALSSEMARTSRNAFAGLSATGLMQRAAQPQVSRTAMDTLSGTRQQLSTRTALRSLVDVGTSQQSKTTQRTTSKQIITTDIDTVVTPRIVRIPEITGFPPFEPSGGGDSGGGRRRGVFSFREIIPAKGLLFRELPAPKGKYVAEDRLYRKETDQLTGKTRKKYYGKLVDRATIVTKRKTVFKRKR